MKNIILPRKKDKYNNRYGFVVAMNNEEAAKILKDLKDRMFGNRKFYMTFANSKKGERKKEVKCSPLLNQKPLIVRPTTEVVVNSSVDQKS